MVYTFDEHKIDTNRKEIVRVRELVNRHIIARDWSGLDAMLDQIDFMVAPEASISAWLRFSYPASHQLKRYKAACARAGHAVRIRGLPPYLLSGIPVSIYIRIWLNRG
jgi:hypothetical protein